MQYDVAESELRRYFKQEWDARFPDSPLYTQNQDARPPTLNTVSQPSDALAHHWGRLTVLWDGSEQADLGTALPRFRSTGAVFVQLFAPAGRGTGDVMSMASEVSGILRRLRLGGMLFRSAYPDPVGSGADGWYQVNVIAPFRYDEIPN